MRRQVRYFAHLHQASFAASLGRVSQRAKDGVLERPGWRLALVARWHPPLAMSRVTALRGVRGFAHHRQDLRPGEHSIKRLLRPASSGGRKGRRMVGYFTPPVALLRQGATGSGVSTSSRTSRSSSTQRQPRMTMMRQLYDGGALCVHEECLPLRRFAVKAERP